MVSNILLTFLQQLASLPQAQQTPPTPGFYTLLLQLLSYGIILAVERQTWCGEAPTYQE